MRLQVMFNKQRALTLMVLVSTALIVFGERVGQYVRIPAQYLVAPAGEATMYVVAGVKSHAGKSEKPMSREELQLLVRQQKVLAYTMQQQVEEFRRIDESMKLFNRIKYSRQYRPTQGVAMTLVPARVLAEDPLPYGETRLLRPGRQAGAQKGQSVVAVRQLVTDRAKALPEGLSVLIAPEEYVSEGDRKLTEAVLVGRIGQTTAFSAQMILVTDRQFKSSDMYIRRIINEDPPRHILVGGHEMPLRDGEDGNNELIPVEAAGNGKELEILSVPAEHNVMKDDWLVLPVQRTYWPADIVVGLVSRVEDPGTGHLKVFVRPATDLSALRNVFIMLPESNGASPPGGSR